MFEVNKNNNKMDCGFIAKHILIVITVVIISTLVNTSYAVELDCKELLMGQFLCPDPNINHMNPKTQQPNGCTKENKAKVWCIAAEGITCTETKNSSFLGDIPCKWT